jgi:predicted nucleic acid-binding Zn ribbon protein
MNPAQDDIADFQTRQQREQRRYHARKPKNIRDVVAKLITLRGYGRFQSDANLASAWQAAAGASLARFSRPGQIRRGKLEVTVSNSTIMQELGFQKQHILAELSRQLPDAKIRDVRFRVGAIS